MSSMLRLALVTRRFWPLVGGAEKVIATLAEELQPLDVEPVILTAQWDSHWPTEIEHAGAVVHRLPQPQIRGWGTIRYLWSLTRWLKQRRREIDAVIVSSLQYDAYAAVSALAGTKIPVLLRAQAGDCHWQREARFGARIKQNCERASAIIATSQQIADELRGAGYAADLVHVIPNGVPLPEPRTPQRRTLARTILGDANPDLRVTEQTPVAVYTGRLETSRGLHDVIQAWRRILDLWPEARLWLIGEGPDREELYDRLRDHELKYHVSMPGAFDDVAELLDAADVFVLPSHEGDTSLSLLEAMAAGLPVVASDTLGNQQLVTHREHGLLVPARNPLALAEAIAEVVTLRDEATLRADRARQRVEQEYSAKLMAQRHVALIQRLRN
jgi:glycosyltransferase involved in cell wall biosynthesis